MGIDGRNNVEQMIEKIVEHTTFTFNAERAESKRSLNMTNVHANAPTKSWIIDRTQSIADQNFDNAKNKKLIQVSPEEWWCWEFMLELHKNQKLWPWTALPRYLRVRRLILKEKDGNFFIWCECGFYHRVGCPCDHFFCLVGEMSITNFHVRHWKLFDVHCHEVSELGTILTRAQVSRNYMIFELIVCNFLPIIS